MDIQYLDYANYHKETLDEDYVIISVSGKMILDMRYILDDSVENDIILYQTVYFCMFEAFRKDYLIKNNKPSSYEEHLIYEKKKKEDSLKRIYQSDSFNDKSFEEFLNEANNNSKEVEQNNYFIEHTFNANDVPIDFFEKCKKQGSFRIPLYIGFMASSSISCETFDNEDTNEDFDMDKINNYEGGCFDIAGAYSFGDEEQIIRDIADNDLDVFELIDSVKRDFDESADRMLLSKYATDEFLKSLGKQVHNYARNKQVNKDILNEFFWRFKNIECNPWTIFLFEQLTSFIETLIKKKIFSRCNNCGQLMKYSYNKKYCSPVSDGKDCGKQARNKRYYNSKKNNSTENN